MRPVANVTFELPFNVAYIALERVPLVVEANGCRICFYPPKDVFGNEPASTSKNGDLEWLSTTAAVEIPCSFDNLNEKEISRRGVALLVQTLDAIRWRSQQPEIDPDQVRTPSSVQYFDADLLPPGAPIGGEPYLVVRTIVGGPLISPPSGNSMKICTTIRGGVGALRAEQRSLVEDDLRLGSSIPIWEDYLLGASRSCSIARGVMDAGIAAEIFIDRYLADLDPSWKLPAIPKDRAKVLKTYLDALVSLKGRDIAQELPAQFEGVRYLYRARNSVAHTGIARYSCDSGAAHFVSEGDVHAFVKDVRACIEWVEALP